MAMMPNNSLIWKNVIGVHGKLPWHYREDLKRFKSRTMNCAIIMGRVTWDSIGRRALPGRRNIVISRSKLSAVEHYHSIEQSMDACHDQDLWVIGGAQIYHAAMPYLTLLDVTYVPTFVTCDDAVRFPEIDLSCWRKGRKTRLPGGDGLFSIVYHRINRAQPQTSTA